MIEFVVESLLWGVSLYLACVTILRGSRTHRANRIILIAAPFICLIAPILNHTTDHSAVLHHMATSPVILPVSRLSLEAVTTAEEWTPPWIGSTVSIIYVLISTALLLRFMTNLLPLLSGDLVKRRLKRDGFEIALIAPPLGPFSFFRTVYVNEDAYDRGLIEADLIRHEAAHSRQCHSLDIVLIELLIIACWWNPFVILFKRLIAANHEYLADESVLLAGANPKEYANMLIQHARPGQPQALTSGFKHTLIRSRLVMLSDRPDKTRFVFRLSALLAVFAVVFSSTALSNLAPSALGITQSSAGTFSADTLLWSSEDQRVFLQGAVRIEFGENDATGNGSFSFLGRVDQLYINGAPAQIDALYRLDSGIHRIADVTPDGSSARTIEIESID